jgi:hypothetical protein
MATLRTATPQVRPAGFALSFVITVISIMLASCPFSLAQTLTVLHTFEQVQDDGYNPFSPVVIDKNGVLYGTTFYGGDYQTCGGCGEVYQVSPPAQPGGAWNYSAIYEFTGGYDGCCVYSALTLDSKGRLYGVTDEASPSEKLFRLKAPAKPGSFWHFQDLYDFKNGMIPTTPLLIDSAGALYGVTPYGGSSGCGGSGCGAVLQFVPTKRGKWTENILYQFTGGADGALPASIVMDSTGTLYGVASEGGTVTQNCPSGCGTAFKLAPGPGGAWTYTVLYRFVLHDHDPYALLVTDSSADLYGLAVRGQYATEVFKLAPRPKGPSVNSLVHRFSPQNVPRSYCGYPTSFLTAGPDGTLYGGIFGDIDLYFGALFQLTPPAGGTGPWTYTTLWDFNESGPDLNPNGVALGPDGALYGTTNGGDSTGGTVFRLQLPSQAPWPPTDFCY